MGVVPRLFPDSTIVCLASGPSLTPEDVAYCRRKAPVIAVNETHQLAPWADVLYACDAKFWQAYEGVPEFAGIKFALQKPAGMWPRVTVLDNTGDHGIETDPSGVRNGRNSGYQAINVAIHLGARRVLLLGYDMQMSGTRRHWFGSRPNKLNEDSPYQTFLMAFASMVAPLKALGVEVINCTRGGALQCFPRMALRDALVACEAAA